MVGNWPELPPSHGFATLLLGMLVRSPTNTPCAQWQRVGEEVGARTYLGGIGLQLQLQGHQRRAPAVRKLLLRVRRARDGKQERQQRQRMAGHGPKYLTEGEGGLSRNCRATHSTWLCLATTSRGALGHSCKIREARVCGANARNTWVWSWGVELFCPLKS